MKSPLYGCLGALALVGCADLSGYSGSPDKLPAPDQAGCGLECAKPADPSPPASPAAAPSTSCQGLACSGAQLVLSNTEKSPASLALAGDRIYWVNTGDKRVRAMPKLGGPAALDLATGNTTPSYTPSSVYVDSAHVYWTELFAGPGAFGEPVVLGRVRSTDLSGNAFGLARDVHPKAPTSALPIVGDEQSLYMCSTPNGGTYESLEVLKVSKNSTSPTTSSFGSFDAPATRLATDVNYIYGIVGASVTLARRAPQGDARSHALDAPATALAALGGYAYVTLPSAGTIRRIDPSPETPTSIEVAAGQDEPREIAAEGSSLYWVNAKTQMLVALSLAPGALPHPIAHVDGTVSSIAVDEDAVYVATGTSIVRITK